ncbi:hypothetical protein CH252_27185 [Rhodococcus sp. 06-1477-1B]|nr:hypothetical protein CH252_27185 [Rhodococcus sp. 06-1477-1B]
MRPRGKPRQRGSADSPDVVSVSPNAATRALGAPWGEFSALPDPIRASSPHCPERSTAMTDRTPPGKDTLADRGAFPRSGPSRRAVITNVAWAVPAIAVATAVPAYAASGTAQSLTVASPNMQVVAAGTTPVTGTVTDSSGSPLAGQAVSFTGPAGTSFSPAIATTNGSGVATTTFTTTNTWATPGSTISVTATSSTLNASAALTVLGANAYAVGDNSNLKLGTGSTSAATSAPAQLSLVFPSPIQAIGSGAAFSLALLADGTVWGIGDNSAGQLGDGTTTSRTTWTKNPTLTGATQIAVGPSNGYALMSDGSVRAWGPNDTGQLGNGTTTDSTSPVTVSGITGATQIASGNGFALALLSSGSVSGWGANDYWQLGGNNYNDVVSRPITVQNIANATQIAAFRSGGYAIVGDDADVYSWGTGDSGELGRGPDAPGDNTGANTSSNSAVLIPGLSGAVYIAGGETNGYARLDDRTVYAWGAGSNGQIGNGDTANQFSPVALSMRGAGRITANGQSAYTTLVFGLSGGSSTYDENIASWGLNSSGQLGDGTTTNRSTRVTVIDTRQVSKLAINSTSATNTFFIR